MVMQQQYKKQGSYVIHHIQPISKGGGVYDMGNLVVVTPRYHQEVLDPSIHFGSK